MLVLSPQLNLIITAASALFCFCPLLNLNWVENHSTDDTIAFQNVTETLLYNGPTLIASFFVVLIPAADLLLDLPSHIASVLYHVNSSSKMKSPSNSVVVRLNEMERLVFILGVGIQSCVWFMSHSYGPVVLGIVYFCTSNASVVLILGPILTYLQRCTTTFTSLRVTVIVLLSAIGQIVYTSSNFMRSHVQTHRLTMLVGVITRASASLCFLLLISLCAAKYCHAVFWNVVNQPAIVPWILDVSKKALEAINGIRHNSMDDDCELYTNTIPALHMTACVVIIVSYLYTGMIPHTYVASAFETKNFTVIIAEIVVLVIELRIRKNEIARGLIALLDSKKSYVRYISHELRTPLNTAFLGLKLLSKDLKASKSPRDKERYDTLCDVNMSCTAAVDILNDLLCHEKLESGHLELHQEKIVIVPFLQECLAMFSVQARECSVALTMMIDGSDEDETLSSGDNSTTHLPLQPYDSIYADKFKMDQVIRNLISNALKFTPSGGAVTLKATFVCNSREGASKSPSAERIESSKWRHRLRRKPSAELWPKSALSPKRQMSPKSRRCAAVACSMDNPRSRRLDADAMCGKLVIVVADTGAGISKLNQGRLFKEIVQFNPEKLQAGGGSGLGLWITQEILCLHGGSINVYSDGEGKGSSFTVEMPMWRQACPTPTVEQIPLGDSRPVSRQSGRDDLLSDLHRASSSVFPSRYRQKWPPLTLPNSSDSFQQESRGPFYEILVVDDSRLNRKMLVKSLTADGHVCFESADGLEAIDMVKERINHSDGGHGKPFDVILMDFIMPNMDGPTATKEIRDIGYTAPILGVTGNGLPSDVTHFLKCGANEIILKPLNLERFAQVMKVLTEDINDDTHTLDSYRGIGLSRDDILRDNRK